jgi:hypothetical protein
MAIVQKPSNSECHTPSSEVFRCKVISVTFLSEFMENTNVLAWVGRCHIPYICFAGHTWQTLIVLACFQCLQSCPEGKYGPGCSYNCTCMNGATCDPVNGTCTCTQGWKGRNCSTRACPDGLFGQSCSTVCQCIVDNTDM